MATPNAYADPRTRGRIKVETLEASTGGSAFSKIPTDLLLGLVLDKTLLASAALLARHWLLSVHSESLHFSNIGSLVSSSGADALGVKDGSINVWAVSTVVFVIAAAAQGVWLRTWTWLPAIKRADAALEKLLPKFGSLAFTMFLHMLVWLMALKRLPATT